MAEAEARAKRASDAATDAAKTLLCPITQTAMSDPVVALDGHTYERDAVERWFAQPAHAVENVISPSTSAPLANLTLRPNHTLRSLMRNYHRPEPPVSPVSFLTRDLSLAAQEATMASADTDAQLVSASMLRVAKLKRGAGDMREDEYCALRDAVQKSDHEHACQLLYVAQAAKKQKV